MTQLPGCTSAITRAAPAPARPPSPGDDRRRRVSRLCGRDAQAVAQHLEWMRLRGLRPASIAQRRQRLAQLAAALPVALLDADAGLLTAWRAELAVGDAAAGNYITNVREFYAWASATGHVAGNSPAQGLHVPRLGRRLPRPIGEAELLGTLEYAPRRIRPWLVLAAWAGLRACEIALLRRECVLDNAAVPVLVIATDATKGRNERTVPMSGFVLAELRDAGIPAGGWMFTRRDGLSGPNSPGIVSKLANAWLHDCGCAATLHQLRHRFGTQAYRASRDLRAVQELLGHMHPSTTAGYAAYDSAAAVDAVSKMPTPPWWQPGDAAEGSS
jgi:integrase